METAFDLLVDPAAVAGALAGSRPSAPGARDGDLVVKVGDTPITFRGRVTPGEQDRDAGALSFHAAGTEVRGRGMVTAGGAVRLREAEHATAVAVQLEIEVSGRMAQQGVDAVETAVRSVLDELAAGLRRQAEEWHPRAAGADREVAEAGEAPGGVLEGTATADERVAYPWMTAAAAAASPTVPAFVLQPPIAAPPRVAPATAVWSPPPGAARPAAPPIPGRVTIVTDGPIQAAGIPVGDSLGAHARALHHRRPWLIPAGVLSILVLLLLLRRGWARGAGGR